MKKMYNFFLLQLHYCCKNNLMNWYIQIQQIVS
jgi:hypothetical protein